MNKPATVDTAFFALPDHRIVALDGRDAVAFVQAQTMNDLGMLADGQWQWNGWLTPKGRVIALFALLRLDAETLWLLLPDADADDLVARLQRFVFRSKVTLASRADLRVSGAFRRADSASMAGIGGSRAAGIELDVGTPSDPRTLRIDGTDAASDAEARARWWAFDLRHGLPRLPASQSDLWTPQQLSLERLRAYSVKKGCYPGQEIVARTHFLGQAKRGLSLLQAATPIAAGDAVEAGDRTIGSVVSVAAVGDPTQTLALAVLPLDRGDTPLQVAGAAVQGIALLDGLAR